MKNNKTNLLKTIWK